MQQKRKQKKIGVKDRKEEEKYNGEKNGQEMKPWGRKKKRKG